MIDHWLSATCYPYCLSCNRLYPELASEEHLYDHDYDEYCNRCGKERTVGECTHENLDIIKEAISPTCTEVGQTVEGRCTGCYIYISSKNLSALGHEWDDGNITTESTCEENGEKTFTCIRGCTKTEVVLSTGHEYGDDGFCSNCPKHISSTQIKYTSNGDGTCSVSQGSYTGTYVVIPEVSPSGDRVVAIENNGFSGHATLETIKICNNLTSIGDNAFYNCRALTKVIFDENSELLTIGKYAFKYCSNLIKIEMPECVISIDEEAFYNCTSIESIKIPSGVTVINKNVFYNCTALSSIALPKNLNKIGESAFSNCKTLKNISLPDGLSVIGSTAFYRCSALTDIIIPKSVSSIGSSAFSDCVAVTEINIPANVKEIGNYAFNGCTSLSKVEMPESLTKIGENAFKDTAIYKVEANWDGNVFYIGTHLIANTTEMTGTYKIREGTTTLAYKSFGIGRCPTGLVIPKSLKYVDSEIMYMYSTLEDIYISDVAQWCELIGDGQYGLADQAENLYLNDKLITELIIPEGVTYIRDYAFRGFSSIKSVKIPESVTSIGMSAFYATGIESVEIPCNVESIEQFAFAYCSYLTSFRFAENSKIQKLDEILNDSAITSIEIPASVTEISVYTLQHCKFLTTIDVAPGNTAYKSVDGVLYTIDGTTLVKYPSAKEDTVFYIPNGVLVIKVFAFDTVNNLTELVVPEGVTEIDNYTIYDCDYLVRITLPKSIQYINSIPNPNGLWYCYRLSEIHYMGSDYEWYLISGSEKIWVDIYYYYR